MEKNELAKLTGEAQLARVRLAGAETKAANAKQKNRLAKRRVKEVKAAARQAKKEARQAKAERLEAKQALAEAEAKLMKARARAEKKQKQELAAGKAKPAKKSAGFAPPARAGKRAVALPAGLPGPARKPAPLAVARPNSAPLSKALEQKAAPLPAKGIEGMPPRTENGESPATSA